MKSQLLIVLLLLMSVVDVTGQSEEKVILHTETGDLAGTLLLPDSESETPVALIIAGSGPTDRDGNNPMMKNNSLRLLAEGLAQQGIASLRYDKRAIGESQQAGMKEEDLRFEHYVEDAGGWIANLRADKRFNQIYVIGHSEGSLIGMIASQGDSVTGFISIAGTGQSADQTIREQLKAQPPAVLETAGPMLDSLVQGKTIEEVPPVFLALFRPSVQPYLISWFRYDPSVEIAKLDMPVLILQGTTDIQVGVSDAERLAAARKQAQLLLIEGMNHIFKEAPADRQQNIATYTQPDLPVVPALIDAIASFIQ